MWFKRWVVLMVLVILPCYVSAMDATDTYPDLGVHKHPSDSDNPTDAQLGNGDKTGADAEEDSKGVIKGLNQDDLAKKLLQNADHLHRWLPRHKVTLAVAIIAVCTSLGLGTYIIYDKVFAPKEGCSGDEHDMVDQIVSEQGSDKK